MTDINDQEENQEQEQIKLNTNELIRLIKGMVINPHFVFARKVRQLPFVFAVFVMIMYGISNFFYNDMAAFSGGQGGFVVVGIILNLAYIFIWWFLVCGVIKLFSVYWPGRSGLSEDNPILYTDILKSVGVAPLVKIVAMFILYIIWILIVSSGADSGMYFSLLKLLSMGIGIWFIYLLMVAGAESARISEWKILLGLVIIFFPMSLALQNVQLVSYYPFVNPREHPELAYVPNPPADLLTDNIIENPGFEKARENYPHVPDVPWNTSMLTFFSGMSSGRVTDEYYSGNASLNLSMTGPGKAFTAIADGRIKLPEGAGKCWIGGMIKTEDVERAYVVRIIYNSDGIPVRDTVDEDSEEAGSLIDDPAAGLLFTGSTDWVPFGMTIDLPEDTRWLVIGFELWGKGRIWFDDMQLRLDIPRPAETENQGAE